MQKRQATKPRMETGILSLSSEAYVKKKPRKNCGDDEVNSSQLLQLQGAIKTPSCSEKEQFYDIQLVEIFVARMHSLDCFIGPKNNSYIPSSSPLRTLNQVFRDTERRITRGEK